MASPIRRAPISLADFTFSRVALLSGGSKPYAYVRLEVAAGGTVVRVTLTGSVISQALFAVWFGFPLSVFAVIAYSLIVSSGPWLALLIPLPVPALGLVGHALSRLRASNDPNMLLRFLDEHLSFEPLPPWMAAPTR
jgi:hypothetical protein